MVVAGRATGRANDVREACARLADPSRRGARGELAGRWGRRVPLPALRPASSAHQRVESASGVEAIEECWKLCQSVHDVRAWRRTAGARRIEMHGVQPRVESTLDIGT